MKHEILSTTTFTAMLSENPTQLSISTFLKEIESTFLDVDIDRHNHHSNAWVISITYPVRLGVEYAEKIIEYCDKYQLE